MKNAIFILALLFLCSCRVADFTGNWYTCAHDGSYIELMIKNNQFRYSTSYGLITQYYKFRLSGDTLIYEDPYLIKDSVWVVKAIMRKTGNDKMTLDFISSDEHWSFFKIPETVGDINDTAELKKGTHYRAFLHKCTDKRTPAERYADSVIKHIDFQF